MPETEMQLFSIIKTFSQKKLWDEVDASQLLALQFPGIQSPVFVSIVGKEEQEKGILIYRSAEELFSFFESRRWNGGKKESPFQMLASQECIALMFMDREELTRPEYDRIKASGVPFRGRKSWPVLADFHAGFVPEALSSNDEELVAQVLKYLSEETDLQKKIESNDNIRNDLQIPYLVYHESGVSDELVYSLPLDLITGDLSEENKPAVLSPFEMEKAKRLPMGSELWELDIQYINQPVEIDASGRSAFPTLLLLGHPFRQEVLESEVLFRQNTKSFQRTLVQNMFRENRRPPQIAIEGRQSDQLIPILKEFLEQLQIDCLVVEVLPFLTVVKENLRHKIDGY